ncbi:MAG: hypothetical protein PHY54_18960 [Methylococcales bacterium]|nr:hypothetical protein [Methylococcales bacterium]
MRLTPSEILTHLGFDIPEKGIDINPYDGFLVTESLHLIGQTMNVAAIPDSDIANMHTGLAGIVAMHRAEEPLPLSDDSILKLRATINALLKVTFKKRTVE